MATDQFPYEPPKSSYFKSDGSDVRPPVWPWYTAYCLILSFIYILLLCVGVALLAFGPQIAEEVDEDAVVMQIQGGALIVISIPCAVLFAAGPFLPKRKWAWIYGFFPICIGFTSCCILPFSIGLLIFWLKPETKAFFSVE